MLAAFISEKPCCTPRWVPADIPTIEDHTSSSSSFSRCSMACIGSPGDQGIGEGVDVAITENLCAGQDSLMQGSPPAGEMRLTAADVACSGTRG